MGDKQAGFEMISDLANIDALSMRPLELNSGLSQTRACHVSLRRPGDAGKKRRRKSTGLRRKN
jgi:hypothetical protein